MPSLSKGLSLSSSLNEEMMTKNMQGITSILGLDSGDETAKSTASLRRTLSADMSSKKWQAQHGFIPLKRIASSDELLPSDKKAAGAGQFDIWSSIVAGQKVKEDELLPVPYVHPLVKKSASSLSGKSLEVCTESLGSETGSDGFSSYPSSEANSDQEEEEVPVEMEPQVAKYNNLAAASSKRVRARSFPPPIPSLRRDDGSCVRMKSYRNNGRMVLEAVSIPSQNNFRAQRQDGRLVLSFVGVGAIVEGKVLTGEGEDEEEIEQFDVEIDDHDKEDVQEEGVEEVGDDKKVGFVMELDTPRLPSGVIMHKLALMMKKPRVLANNMNPNWCNKFDDLIEIEKKKEEMALEQTSTMTQLLPPRPPMAHRMITTTKATVVAAPIKAVASLNAYEYYWKTNSTGPARAASKVSGFSSIIKKPSTFEENNNNQVLFKSYIANERQQMMLLRGEKGGCLVPLLKCCQDPRRSFSLRESHCIATS